MKLIWSKRSLGQFNLGHEMLHAIVEKAVQFGSALEYWHFVIGLVVGFCSGDEEVIDGVVDWYPFHYPRICWLVVGP